MWPTTIMIDKKNGHLIISNKIHIKPNDLKKDILSLKLGQTRDERDLKNDWTGLIEKNICVGDKFFILDFSFFKNKLKTVSIIFQETLFDVKNGWESWTEEKELLKLKLFKKWLTAEIGKERDFDWGVAEVGYDKIGGYSSIVIRYT